MVAAGVAGAAVGAVAAHALADDKPTSTEQRATQAGVNQSDDQQQAVQAQHQEKKVVSLVGYGYYLLLLLPFCIPQIWCKKKLAANNPYAPNNNGQNMTSRTAAPTNTSGDTNIFGQSVGGGTATQAPFGGATTSNGNQLPDGSEPASFLRVARQRFNHIQSINSASNVEEIRRYLTPELYNSMYNDIMENQDQDVAEFSNLNAMVVDSATENGQYIVSVRFTGTVSEDLNSLPQPFTEIWHFVKPVGSQQDWVVAGIQQA